MLFPSISFLYYFLPLTLILYFILPQRLRNALLLLMSLVFYAWSEQLGVLLFGLAIVFGWGAALGIEKCRSRRGKKLMLALSLGVLLAMLGYFKYADFFISCLKAPGLNIELLNVALPIGISFYTFQLMSYIIDVYRGSVTAQRNPIDFGAYISFFPQLIAGPIVRYSAIEDKLRQRRHSLEAAGQGMRRFILGLAKKVLIANALAELTAAYKAASEVTILFAWLYAVGFMLQIYFDFSAYSDMAIGLAKIFGFELPENFDYPYISKSITEFWRRWHISLGSWFRDYVYIPLGGSRRGRRRQIINLLIVWALTGLWHGAAWNFVLWGLFYAALLIAEKLWLLKGLEKHPFAAHLYVLFAVMLGFVLFNADSAVGAAENIAALFAFKSLPLVNIESLYYLRSYALTLMLAAALSTPYPARLLRRLGEKKPFSYIEPLLPPALLLLVTAYLVDGSFNPFLYFRF